MKNWQIIQLLYEFLLKNTLRNKIDKIWHSDIYCSRLWGQILQAYTKTMLIRDHVNYKMYRKMGKRGNFVEFQLRLSFQISFLPLPIYRHMTHHFVANWILYNMFHCHIRNIIFVDSICN